MKLDTNTIRQFMRQINHSLSPPMDNMDRDEAINKALYLLEACCEEIVLLKQKVEELDRDVLLRTGSF